METARFTHPTLMINKAEHIFYIHKKNYHSIMISNNILQNSISAHSAHSHKVKQTCSNSQMLKKKFCTTKIYLFEKAISAWTINFDFCFSMVTLLPMLPVFPLTLTFSWRNFSWKIFLTASHRLGKMALTFCDLGKLP